MATKMATKKAKGDAAVEKVVKAGLARDDTKYLYFVDKSGDVVRMERGVARAKSEVVFKTGIKREKGWGYFLDADGDIAREPD